MEHFRKVHRFLLNVKTVLKDIFFMRYLKVFVIKNGDDFINSRCALLLECVTRRFLQASFSLISCYFELFIRIKSTGNFNPALPSSKTIIEEESGSIIHPLMLLLEGR